MLRLVAEEEARKTPRKPRSALVTDVKPLTKAQGLYDVAIASKDVVFGIGPAGTGKTWLAVARAAQALQRKEIHRIVITRPALEAGKGLGFLPGDMAEKFDPYLKPVRDAFDEFFGASFVEYMLEMGVIEIAPLGFLRGNTFKDTWLIADEMQNATKAEMQLLLSRIGQNAKFLINGDPMQCDLSDPRSSGLEDAIARFQNHSWCGVARFEVDDIVRSGICRDIIIGYSERREDSRYSSVSNDDDEVAGLRRNLRA